MKKIIYGLLIIFFITGCNMDMNSPTKRVEEFFLKYQQLDSDVLTSLDNTVSNDNSMDDEQKKEYIELMKKQYQNMSYKIKDEDEKDNGAIIYVEVEVYDYRSAIDTSMIYYENNKDEFRDEDGKVDNKKITDYKINEMKKVTDRVKYDITFNLTKINNNYILDDVKDDVIEKLHGLYK